MRITPDIRVVLPIFTVFLVFSSGCTIPDTSTTSTGVPGYTLPAQGSADIAFLSLYESSGADIATRLENVHRCFPAETAVRNVPYMATDLRTAALELKGAADTYHTTMIKIGPFEMKEHELQRNEYLKYLSTIRKSAGDIAGAAEGELNGEFGLAQTYAESAKISLKNPVGIPGSSHEHLLKEIGDSLDDYIQKMRGKRI
ncbi:MAG: hypothetical protein WC502_04485 [Methanolinea sp.]|jgi:hypothetical protein|nr:hypothetical protein [Methanolinea sp.]